MYTQNQWQGDPDSSGVDDVAFTMEMLDNFERYQKGNVGRVGEVQQHIANALSV